ncbi:Coiled-coil domain-containing protein 148 [Channa argus]|uniref:Coiled-coil domain-containing protein 148 n=1 Tax=Channa argus TaxID=215402 RepID=A0A6G1PX42_CHAAH|nr:Coiled-coil domain-containing protein 148 [Channa argus]
MTVSLVTILSTRTLYRTISQVISEMDLSTFNTIYRAEDVEKLTHRMKNGLGSSKYKPAEYKKLQAIVDAKRLEFDLIGQKVQKTRCAAKATKESSILRQHRQVWSRECSKLEKAEEKAENDVQDFLNLIRPNDRTDTAMFSLQEYELFLQQERKAFRIATVEPINQLRDDLCFRLKNVQPHQHTAQPSNWEQVIQQIRFVKDQQDDITAKVNAEYLALEEEIMCLDLEKYLTTTPDNLVNIEMTPEEVLDSDCPYPQLKDSLIQAFHTLSERYQRRIQSLQELLQRTDRFCGWCPDDHQRYQFTVSQYTHDIPNYRTLCMDMLQRLFPGKISQELMEHKRVSDQQHFTKTQLRVVNQQWQRDWEELLARALATLQEARYAHQEELELHRDRQHQQDICSHLRDKLQRWQAQQEEVARLEAAIAARQQEEEEARFKREQEKEDSIRSQQKEKVRQFYLKQQKRKEELEQRDQKRLANLRSIMEDQAKKDKERVLFRADMLQRRREEREAQEIEQQREEEKKQNRLEALRNQVHNYLPLTLITSLICPVRVVAEPDPERMMAETDAWRNRQLNVKEFELQRPLFSINTYTDTQIVSDLRLRVEQALREAGLHHNQYAKEVLSVIKPPKPPRRGTKSILKF